MRKTLLRTSLVFAAGLIVLLASSAAQALKFELDELVVSATVDVTPRILPATGNAPVELSSVTRVQTKDGSPTPQLDELTFMLDKHGVVSTKGLPVCTAAKLAETTPAVARKRCKGAIVGEGVGSADVRFPGAAPMKIRSPLTFFNAPPEGGRPTLIAHAYETVPVAKTLLVPIPIERIQHGRYGYRVRVEFPEIAAGFGAATLAEATIGATWKRGGKTVGYVSAHCSAGRLQVNGKVIFKDGSFFPGTLTSPCRAPD